MHETKQACSSASAKADWIQKKLSCTGWCMYSVTALNGRKCEAVHVAG